MGDYDDMIFDENFDDVSLTFSKPDGHSDDQYLFLQEIEKILSHMVTHKSNNFILASDLMCIVKVYF